MLEKEIEQKLRKRVQAAGGRCPKFVSPGNRGVPDRICILPGGKIIFIELKTSKGTMQKGQEYWARVLLELGCDVRSVKWSSELEQLLEDLKI